MTASPDFVNDPRFSQSFELPADPASGRTGSFKVTYADYGYRNEAHPEQENVLLFSGSLLGSRLVHIAKDELAKKHKIRIIHADRPGFGGTGPASVGERMSVWRGVILALLRHLEIQHVSVACHSAGTFYGIDLLLHNPEILHPERPYLAIGGPWILPSHTGRTAMSIVHSLPASIIGQTDKLALLINNHIGPLLGASFGLSANIMARLAPAPSQDAAAEERDGAKLEDQLWPHLLEKVYSEDVHGISADAVLLMQKGGVSGWGDWGDYDAGVPRLGEVLRAATGMARLTVDVFYAENDDLIGGRDGEGAQWFDGCWLPSCGDVVDYQSTTVKGADHDWVWNLRWGAVQTMFEKIGRTDEPNLASSDEPATEMAATEVQSHVAE